MNDSEIKSYLDFILPLVKDSGELLLEAKNIKVETKSETWDLVTMYDKKIEEVLIDKIKLEYPKHKFIGEEESSDKNAISALTDDPTWIIDPIDGTANFVRGLPITCIAVGLTINKEVVLGVVFNPYMDELYVALKGKGAYLNGVRLQTSGLENIAGACFNYELSLARSEKWRDTYLYRLQHLIGVTQGVRSLGCAVLGLCYVARGLVDAYQCDGLYPWDVAAGSLIVQESGGFIGDTMGKPKLDIMNPNFLATASEDLYEQFMEIERRADAERIAKTGK